MWLAIIQPLYKRLIADMGEFWVFGYGSLMWRPGFDHQGGQ
ncbi:MAG: gamma-glutamylcyclotransferase, partial [Rhizobiaceae bacterium]